MVQGPHQENRVERAPRHVLQVACIVDPEVNPISKAKLICFRRAPDNELFGKVDSRDPVAALGKRKGVSTRAKPEFEELAGRWQVPFQVAPW